MNAHELLGHGLGVALVTPFTTDGAVDATALTRLVEHVRDGGCDFVVVLGSTGEASMLSQVERTLVVALVDACRGPMRLVVGTGASSTSQACSWTTDAAALGADAALVVVPPYTRPTQDGVLAHFEAVQRAAPGLPLIAYNVPSRTGANMTPETVARLWRLSNVVALKESSGDLLQITRIAAALPADRALLAGDDALLLPSIAVGAHGVVSVAGNLVPDAMRRLLDAARSDELTAARALARELLPLFDALCLEPNPIPIKAALALAGVGRDEPRLPLLPAQETTRAALQAALHATHTPTVHG